MIITDGPVVKMDVEFRETGAADEVKLTAFRWRQIDGDWSTQVFTLDLEQAVRLARLIRDRWPERVNETGPF